MTEIFSIDLVNLFIFTMPGFFLLYGFGVKKETDFEYFMLSMFWGIIIAILYYKILPNMITLWIENIYAGGILLSITSFILGLTIRHVFNKFIK